MLENELDNNREPGDGSGGPDHGAVSTGTSRGGVSSRPAGPPAPVPPAPSVPAIAFQAPQVLFQPPPTAAPPPAVAPAAPVAPPAVEPSGSDVDAGGSRSSTRRRSSSRTKADAEAAPPKQGGRGNRRGAKSAEAKPAEDAEPTPAPEPELPVSDKNNEATTPEAGSAEPVVSGSDEQVTTDDESDEGGEEGGQGSRRRRRRGGRSRSRGRGNGSGDASDADDADDADGDSDQSSDGAEDSADTDDDDQGENGGQGRRRRRKRRRGSVSDTDKTGSDDDPPDTVVHVREARPAAAAATRSDDVRSVKGSTRLEAKRQRRREGRESGRRRPPVITEAEFLARREAVERTMVVRRRGDRTQIAVLEDDILVEHYVNRASHQSYVGNVYLGKVQNVLPSMEAAFVDIGKGRNAVLYAGEVNFDASGLEGQSKRIESALKSGQSILVQVTKDPVGHKGARLTSQVSLPGRYLVYVPGASMTGISRKLPDTERTRLKKILKKVMPEDAGVIVRTAAEGATEEELERDVARLAAQWETIERKSKTANAPDLLLGEPDLTIRVIRDVFNEDFGELIVSGDEGWAEVDEYVSYVAPHLADRLSHAPDDNDVFAEYRIDEQLSKALERKVWLPSGGSLVIDRTEAMTVIDVNTGKFTGQGGNLEETVTRNNLEAAEEIVRQLRLRDVGGIIVIDFIDMVLESNRELVLRRLLECLARDRTKHQVAEVTSLGLVQMTRKRVGAGLLEAFSTTCECCNGRGVHVSLDLADIGSSGSGQSNGSGNGNGGNGHGRGRHGSEPKSDEAKSNGNGGGSNGNGNGESKPGEGRRSRNRRRGNRPDQIPDPSIMAGSVATTEPADAPALDDVAVTAEPSLNGQHAAAPADLTPVTDAPSFEAAPAPEVVPAPEATSSPEAIGAWEPTAAPEPTATPLAPEPTSAPSVPEPTPAPEASTVGVGPDLEATEVPAPGADLGGQDPEPPTEGH
jgi:ribonuclease E